MARRVRRPRRTGWNVVVSDEDLAAEEFAAEPASLEPSARRRPRRRGRLRRHREELAHETESALLNGHVAQDQVQAAHPAGGDPAGQARRDSGSTEPSPPEVEERTATGFTVFRSPTIESFRVQLLGAGPAGGGRAGQDILLGRAGGPLIEELGGVPSGASGSPVMVDGKILGALAYVFPPDFSLVGITPIEAMLALTREPGLSDAAPLGVPEPGGSDVPADGKASRQSRPVLGSRFVLPVANGFQHLGARAALESSLNVRFPAAYPGRSSEAPTLEVGYPAAVTDGRELKPGSPVGVGLLVGDLRVGVIGTVTLVQDQDVFAFGHPVFFTGPSQLPLTAAVILETAHGPEPAKIGDIGQVIGTVTQDRAAGILGRLDQAPPLVELRYCVYDQDRGRTEVLLAGAAASPVFLPMLASVAAQEAMLRAMNRIGQGTAAWEWIVTVRELPDPVRRQEVATDETDIGAVVAESVVPFLEQLLQQGLTVAAIDLSARVEMAPAAPLLVET